MDKSSDWTQQKKLSWPFVLSSCETQTFSDIQYIYIVDAAALCAICTY